MITESKFNIAKKLLAESDGKRMQGAKYHLINGVSQSAAAAEFGVSRQAVSKAAAVIQAAYTKAVKIQELISNNGGTDTELPASVKYQLGVMLIQNNNKRSLGLKAAWLVLVKNWTFKDAAKEYSISATTLHKAVNKVVDNYNRAIEISEMMENHQ